MQVHPLATSNPGRWMIVRTFQQTPGTYPRNTPVNSKYRFKRWLRVRGMLDFFQMMSQCASPIELTSKIQSLQMHDCP